MDAISNIANMYASGGGATSHQEAGEHYQQVSNAVPTSILGSVIGPALASLGTQEMTQKILDSAGEMRPQQRGSLFENLLGGLTPSGTDPSSLLSNLGIAPAVASDPNSATPEDVAALAAHAKETNPDVFQSAMSFFGEHPALVKTFGAVAIGAIIKGLSSGGRAASAR
jgi:hypothetical protein